MGGGTSPVRGRARGTDTVSDPSAIQHSVTAVAPAQSFASAHLHGIHTGANGAETRLSTSGRRSAPRAPPRGCAGGVPGVPPPPPLLPSCSPSPPIPHGCSPTPSLPLEVGMGLSDGTPPHTVCVPPPTPSPRRRPRSPPHCWTPRNRRPPPMSPRCRRHRPHLHRHHPRPLRRRRRPLTPAGRIRGVGGGWGAAVLGPPPPTPGHGLPPPAEQEETAPSPRGRQAFPIHAINVPKRPPAPSPMTVGSHRPQVAFWAQVWGRPLVLLAQGTGRLQEAAASPRGPHRRAPPPQGQRGGGLTDLDCIVGFILGLGPRIFPMLLRFCTGREGGGAVSSNA